MIEDFKCQNTEIAHNLSSSEEQLKIKRQIGGGL